MAEEREIPEDVMRKAGNRKPSSLIGFFAPRYRKEDLGEAVGLAQAAGSKNVGTLDRYPALRTLILTSKGMAGGAIGGAALGGIVGTGIGAANAEMRGDDKYGSDMAEVGTGMAVGGGLAGLSIGGLIGAIVNARTQKRRIQELTREGLDALPSVPKVEVAKNVNEAMKDEPSWPGALVGTGAFHRGRMRTLNAAAGRPADTRLNKGLTVLHALLAGWPRFGINIYDTFQAKEQLEDRKPV